MTVFEGSVTRVTYVWVLPTKHKSKTLIISNIWFYHLLANVIAIHCFTWYWISLSWPMVMSMFDVKKAVVIFVWQEFGSKHIYVWHGQLIVASMLDALIACAHMHNVYVVYWPQLRRAPIKFGRFIKGTSSHTPHAGHLPFAHIVTFFFCEARHLLAVDISCTSRL